MNSNNFSTYLNHGDYRIFYTPHSTAIGSELSIPMRNAYGLLKCRGPQGVTSGMVGSVESVKEFFRRADPQDRAELTDIALTLIEAMDRRNLVSQKKS